ncbi:hypothetical protein, partial [Bradyrhizobium pachyrhizi]|uniref:hypothetical protein n=1 Tax=Bradyrhizobium pachyrhizi TaxID=280333 RepID=UPI001AEBD4F0
LEYWIIRFRACAGDDAALPESRTILIVVLAKARTHYPESRLLRDAGAATPFVTEFGGYGSPEF